MVVRAQDAHLLRHRVGALNEKCGSPSVGAVSREVSRIVVAKLKATELVSTPSFTGRALSDMRREEQPRFNDEEGFRLCLDE